MAEDEVRDRTRTPETEAELQRWLDKHHKFYGAVLFNIIAERDAAVAEANRRDQKWMDGIRDVCKANISFDGLTDDGPGQYAMTLDRFVGKLIAERDAARAEVERLRKALETIESPSWLNVHMLRECARAALNGGTHD